MREWKKAQRLAAAGIVALFAGAGLRDAEAKETRGPSAAHAGASAKIVKTAAHIKAFVEDAGSRLRYGGAARPIAAYTEFCRAFAEKCRPADTGPATVVLTPELLSSIESVNRQVNKDIKPLTDAEHWGVVDRWNEPEDGYGDCEDYQLEKLRLLDAAGIVPRAAMSMIVVTDPKGDGHAVLAVHTDKGDLILNNMHSDVLFAREVEEANNVFIRGVSFADHQWRQIPGVETMPLQLIARARVKPDAASIPAKDRSALADLVRTASGTPKTKPPGQSGAVSKKLER